MPRCSVSKEGARLVKAKVDLRQAERQEELAREDLAAQIKLLEIDLADANLRLNHASMDEPRMKIAVERGAAPTSQYEKILLGIEQAKLQVDRAQTLLDRYRKALPEKKREPADEGAPPDTKDDNRQPGPAKKDLPKTFELPGESGGGDRADGLQNPFNQSGPARLNSCCEQSNSAQKQSSGRQPRYPPR